MALLVECSEIFGGNVMCASLLSTGGVDNYTLPQLYRYSCYLYPLAYFYCVKHIKKKLGKSFKG